MGRLRPGAVNPFPPRGSLLTSKIVTKTVKEIGLVLVSLGQVLKLPLANSQNASEFLVLVSFNKYSTCKKTSY